MAWNDPSGDRLRDWMGIDRDVFYDTSKVALIPMGFCYPGTGSGGDLPPRPECAPLWHAKLLAKLPKIALTLLAGSYAQAYYLDLEKKQTLTATVRSWRDHKPKTIPLPHPSPRNNRWLAKNPWFEEEVVPYLKRVKSVLRG